MRYRLTRPRRHQQQQRRFVFSTSAPPPQADLGPVSFTVTVQAVTGGAPAPSANVQPVALTVAPQAVLPERTPEPPTHLIWVYDYTGTQAMVLHELLALETDDRLQDSETLRFTIAADDPKAAYVLGDTMARYRDRYYRITSAIPTRDGTRVTIDVEAEALWTDLAGTLRVGDFTIVNATAAAGATTILAGTGWTLDTDATVVTSAIYDIDQADQSVLALLRAWATITTTEISFDTANHTVAFVEQVGGTQDLGFRYGLNLRGIKRRWAPPACTKLYPYGRNGLTIEAITAGDQFIEDFSFYEGQGLTEEEARAAYTRSQVWSDDSFVSDAPLYDAAVARLARLSQPIIAYESTVADLAAATDAPIGRYRIGDYVPVVDDPLDIAVRARVVRLVRHPLNPSDTTIELAYLQGPALDQSALSRGGSEGKEWLLFGKDSEAARTIGSPTAIPCDVGLQYSDGGDAVVNAELVAVATGSGTARFVVWDEVANAALGESTDIAFTTGQVVHWTSAFGLQNLSGNILYSLRVRVATGTGTLAIAQGDARLWILTKGGLGVSIAPNPNSIRFDFTGNTQTWTVPAGIARATVDCFAGAGGGAIGGKGGRIRSTIDVVEGEVLNVEVGQHQTVANPGGGPPAYNGGATGGGAAAGSAGGGASDVRRGSTLADRLIVAGGGGGAAGGGWDGTGGGGGYTSGDAGIGGTTPAGGGTSSAGGTAGIWSGVSRAGTAGTLGVGGDGFNGGGGTAGGGGGGGGLYGGGGGGDTGGGGGGSSAVPDTTGTEILAENAVNTGHGYVIISWDQPV